MYLTGCCPSTDVYGLQITYFIIGLFVLSFGCGMYIAPNMGAGPRDTLMMILVEIWRIY